MVLFLSWDLFNRFHGLDHVNLPNLEVHEEHDDGGEDHGQENRVEVTGRINGERENHSVDFYGLQNIGTKEGTEDKA